MIELFRQFANTITSFTQKILDYIENKRKWKLKIYFLNQLVCTKRIENFKEIKDIFNKPYICRVHKKHIFNTINTQVILIANKALFLDENKREIHINCIIYEGVEQSEIQNKEF